jgi:hypothetical protein
MHGPTCIVWANLTPFSLQGLEDRTPAIRARYAKPVIWDEVEYEGNISAGWGQLSGLQVGLERIVALYGRSSTSHQNR